MMWTTSDLTSILLLVVHLCLVNSQQLDPCRRYTFLHDPEGFYSAGAATPAAKTTCQRLMTPGWYRVRSPSGEDMPTHCVETMHCRTRFPVWLKEPLPPADGKIHQLQVAVTTDSCQGDPDIEYPIRVKNCGKFRVYYLPRVPFCQVAYCFGTETICPPRTGSATGFSPGCIATSVTIEATVTVKVQPVVKANKHQIEFECALDIIKFEVHPPQPVTYDVKWYTWRSGVSKLVLEETKDLPLTVSESILPVGLNVDVSCHVRARGTASGAPSPFMQSNKHFVGLKFEPNAALIFKNGGANSMVKLISTVPFVCKDQGFQCHLDFEIVITNNQKRVCSNNPPLLGTTQPNCRTRLAGIMPGNQVVGTQQAEFKLEASANAVFDTGTYTMKLYMRTPLFNPDHRIWRDYTAPPLTITVFDKLLPAAANIKLTSSVCYANNDPHMRTFDGCLYENQVGGEFILYKHKILPYQVNIFTSPCYRNAFCTQGVAIMSGMTHYIWDRRVPSRDTYLNCDEHNLEFNVVGNTKTITFKTGTKVLISGYTGIFANVRIIPSIQDIGLTEGLCQNLDGRRETLLVGRNGVTTRCSTTMNPGLRAFAKSWSIVDATLSLYNQNLNVYKAAIDHPGVGLCDCACKNQVQCDKAVCDTTKWTTECDIIGNNQNALMQRQCWRRIFNRRRKRAAGELPDDDYSDTRRPGFAAEEWPADPSPKARIWNEAMARKHCEQAIVNSTAGQICTKIENVHYEDAIETCIKDILLTDTLDWVGDAVDSMKLSCKNEVHRNFSRWEKPSGSDVVAPPVHIMNELCPGSCSGHGNCIKGECRCHTGYEDDDCSVSLTQPPSISPGREECDRSIRPCLQTPVYGRYFINSDKLMCRIRVSTVGPASLGGHTPQRVKSETHPAEYLHREEVMCPLPAVKPSANISGMIYEISVSNDGKKFGNTVRTVAYNKECVSCNGTMFCDYKPGYCYLDGRCHQHGALHPSNPQLECDASKNTWLQKVCTEETKADIALLLDGSGSMRDNNPADWSTTLKFSADIAERLTIGENGVRIAVIKFGNLAKVQFPLNRYFDKNDMKTAITNIRYTGGNTNTSGAIWKMRTQIFDPTGQDESNGDRSDVKNIAIIFTDGKSTRGSQDTIPYANDAKAQGIRVFVVGLTDSVNRTELAGLSSDAIENQTYWMSADTHVLNDIIHSIVQMTCQTVQPAATTSTKTGDADDSERTGEDTSTENQSPSVPPTKKIPDVLRPKSWTT